MKPKGEDGAKYKSGHDIGPNHKPCRVLNVSLKIQDNNMFLRGLMF